MIPDPPWYRVGADELVGAMSLACGLLSWFLCGWAVTSGYLNRNNHRTSEPAEVGASGLEALPCGLHAPSSPGPKCAK